MGLFGDVIHFFSSLVTNKKTNSESFLSALQSADRYIRWGMDRKNKRDFEKAIDILKEAQDKKASGVELIERKYAIYLQAINQLANMLAAKCETDIQKINQDEQLLQQMISQTELKLSTTEQMIKEFESERAAVRVKELQKEHELLIERKNEAQRQIDSKIFSNAKSSAIQKTIDEIELITSPLQQDIKELAKNSSLPQETVSAIVEKVRVGIQSIYTKINQIKK